LSAAFNDVGDFRDATFDEETNFRRTTFDKEDERRGEDRNRCNDCPRRTFKEITDESRRYDDGTGCDLTQSDSIHKGLTGYPLSHKRRQIKAYTLSLYL
jgi:hypothetical protein